MGGQTNSRWTDFPGPRPWKIPSISVANPASKDANDLKFGNRAPNQNGSHCIGVRASLLRAGNNGVSLPSPPLPAESELNAHHKGRPKCAPHVSPIHSARAEFPAPSAFIAVLRLSPCSCCLRRSRQDRRALQPKLARFTVWRKSAPFISTLMHISARRDRIRSPIRSPRVCSRAARSASL